MGYSTRYPLKTPAAKMVNFIRSYRWGDASAQSECRLETVERGAALRTCCLVGRACAAGLLDLGDDALTERVDLNRSWARTGCMVTAMAIGYLPRSVPAS